MLEIVQASDWTRVDHWPWPNFTPAEMRCTCCGKILVSVAFMNRLQAIRTEAGYPIGIVSGYRCPNHNALISSTGSTTGSHTYGRAVDPSIPGGPPEIPRFLSLAHKHGMTRVGLKVCKVHGYQLHIDNMTAAEGFAVRDDGHLFCWPY